MINTLKTGVVTPSRLNICLVTLLKHGYPGGIVIYIGAEWVVCALIVRMSAALFLGADTPPAEQVEGQDGADDDKH